MRTPSFLAGVGLALAASLVAEALFDTLTWIWPVGLVLRLVVAGLGLAYCLYLLALARARAGRLTALLAWLAIALAVGLWSPPLPVFLLAHVGLTWLLRSLFFHQSLAAALADLALNGWCLAFALAAAARSGSLLLSVWCFFLSQALFVLIPQRLAPRQADSRPPSADDRFQRACRAAEAALRDLASSS